MRYEIRSYEDSSRGERFYLVDLVNQRLVSVAENRYGDINYGTEQECEKKLMQLLAEGGRPTKEEEL